jgi:hypothetical protein
MTDQCDRTEETDLDQFVQRVSRLVGYDTPPPESIHGLIEKLRKQGYTPWGAAQQVRRVLDINKMKP